MRPLTLIVMFACGCNLFSEVEQRDDGDAGMSSPDDGARADAPRDWRDAGWSQRAPVTLDLSDFAPASDVPVPIRVSSAVLNGSAEGGRDLRVVDADGVPVPFEIARWDDDPIVWTVVDVTDRPGPHLWLYFGNPDASSASDPTQVWAEFELALHFDGPDLGFNSADPSWAFDPIGAPKAASGRVGASLDAGSGALRFPNGPQTTPLNLQIGQQATFTSCVSTTSSDENQTILWKEGDCQGWSLRVQSAGGASLNLRHSDDGCNGWEENRLTSAEPVNDDSWHCVTGRMDRAAGTIVLTVDGQHVASGTLDNTRDASGGELRIGTNYDDSARLLGRIDEAWISTDVRSDAWVEAVHAALLRNVATVGPAESITD